MMAPMEEDLPPGPDEPSTDLKEDDTPGPDTQPYVVSAGDAWVRNVLTFVVATVWIAVLLGLFLQLHWDKPPRTLTCG
ncbi:hypothetical protein Phou_039760 [Phytohabitans houttuyneae]|uniref:Uncharacterized protein n=1 Tax=Phytohabitans houttuyneae TaxID=1076126 RepID=A0A6V8KCR5_9ACTN|nr:hypothetical protein Phou_039760 [Phytohabitans houttuyneae]